MKQLVLKQEIETKNKTLAQNKKESKENMARVFKRLDTLIQFYFETGEHERIYEELLESSKINKNIFDRYFCFESSDIPKMTSFLTRIFELPYFAANTKNITISQFVDMVYMLLTAKDKKIKIHTFNLVSSDAKSLDRIGMYLTKSYIPKRESFKIETLFCENTFIDIFDMYL